MSQVMRLCTKHLVAWEADLEDGCWYTYDDGSRCGKDGRPGDLHIFGRVHVQAEAEETPTRAIPAGQEHE